MDSLKTKAKIGEYEDFEELMKQLGGEKVVECKVSGFYRSFKFKGYLRNRPVTMILTWFKNISYVYIGATQMNFTHAWIDGCWPNRCGRNLNLSLGGDETSVVIALQHSYDTKGASK